MKVLINGVVTDSTRVPIAIEFTPADLNQILLARRGAKANENMAFMKAPHDIPEVQFYDLLNKACAIFEAPPPGTAAEVKKMTDKLRGVGHE